MEEESSKLEINLNIPISQGNIEGTHKAGRIPGSNMFKYEEIKAQRQRLCKSALRWKHRVESGQEQNVYEDKDHPCLMTITEETEINDATVLHDKIQTDVGIQLKQKTDIINTVGHQKSSLSVECGEETEEVTVKVTEDRHRNHVSI